MNKVSKDMKNWQRNTSSLSNILSNSNLRQQLRGWRSIKPNKCTLLPEVLENKIKKLTAITQRTRTSNGRQWELPMRRIRKLSGSGRYQMMMSRERQRNQRKHTQLDQDSLFLKTLLKENKNIGVLERVRKNSLRVMRRNTRILLKSMRTRKWTRKTTKKLLLYHHKERVTNKQKDR